MGEAGVMDGPQPLREAGRQFEDSFLAQGPVTASYFSQRWTVYILGRHPYGLAVHGGTEDTG
jgi:hypothetical protein